MTDDDDMGLVLAEGGGWNVSDEVSIWTPSDVCGGEGWSDNQTILHVDDAVGAFGKRIVVGDDDKRLAGGFAEVEKQFV